ncbi:AAA family ATPase [Streptomyces sp. NBC_01190]|uniref:AAA family ATPase n=1 Tax=Streptomyces sp. NBC_01190 TaxID=2903767 RepID=UPI0038698DA5|nr:LuxR C-terminal-related transcriptional regulator [Streptomyces sp. NBC_01190]
MRGSPYPQARVTGRDALLVTAARALTSGTSVLLTGAAGLGRTTLLNRLAAEQVAEGRKLIGCNPAPDEQRLPHLGLIDLFAEVGDAFLDGAAGLSRHEQTVLRAVLHRSPAPDGPPPANTDHAGHADTELALHMAVLKTLTALCARGPVLLAVDDAQWLDPPTARSLVFAVRRTRHLPLTVLATARTPGANLGRLLPPSSLRLTVPPMTERETTTLLAESELPAWPHPLPARIAQAAAGNPYIALELGRALAAAGHPPGRPDPGGPLPLPAGVRDLLLDRLAPLSARARRTLLAAGAADRPTSALLRRAGYEFAAADLAEAAVLGIIEAPTPGSPGAAPLSGAARPAQTVRFTHPLMARAVYEAATPGGRRRVHAALAEAAEDPVERAHHLASLTPGWDARTAALLADAASAARRRGAPAIAARLGQLAADHTPPGDPAADTDRRLTAAEDAVAAGDYPLARRIAHEVLAGSGRPTERVRAWIVVLDSCGQALAEVADVFPQALQDASGDPELLARLHYRMSWRAWVVAGSADEAHTHAARSAVLAREAGDRRTELLALSQQSALEFYLGRAAAEQTLALALAPPQDPRVLFDHNGPVFLKHRRHVLHDRLDDARTELRALVYTVRHRGSAESLCQCLSGLAQVEILRGRCERALDLAHQCLRVTEQAGLSQGPAWYAVALAEASGGSPDRALAAAERARRHSEDDDDQLFLPRALHAEGHVRLLRGETAAAVHALQRTRLLELGQGQGDPAVRRWQGDLAEALVAAGCADEAAALLAETRAQALRLGRPGVLVVLDRCAALVTEARGEPDAAVAQLERAAAESAALPYRLEEARTRLTLGRVHARRGDPRAARAALAEAARLFTRAGARPWLALTSAELDHLDLPAAPPAPGLTALTATERRVALLVAQGATNRETAAVLTVSVKTVEAALTRAYRKLGVRSRVSLSRALLSSPQEEATP